MEMVASRRLPQRASRASRPPTPCETAARPDPRSAPAWWQPTTESSADGPAPGSNRRRNSCPRACQNAGRFCGAPQVKGQMSEQTTPFSSSVFRRDLSGCDGLSARSAASFRRPSQAVISSLQQAGASRLTRGAPARGPGSASATRRIARAAAL